MATPGTAGNGMAAPIPAAPAPIFLSGSHHREAMFGQEIVPAPVMIADLKQRRKAAEEKAARKAKGLDGKLSGLPRLGSKRSGVKAGTVSVKELIDAELIKPGKNNLTVTYKGTIYRASLLATGQIDYNGQVFDAPSAFSVFVKRIQTPTKQGDDGWNSVHVEGASLDTYRQRLLTDRAAAAAAVALPESAALDSTGVQPEVKSEGGTQVKTESAVDGSTAAPAAEPAAGDLENASSGAAPAQDGATEVKAEVKSEEPLKDEPPPEPAVPCIYFRQLGPDELPPLPSTYDVHIAKASSPDPDADGEEGEGEEGEPDTSNWVQCARCQAWRVVPDEFWPDIDQAGDEDWYCEEATWDLTLYDPFTKSCKEYGT